MKPCPVFLLVAPGLHIWQHWLLDDPYHTNNFLPDCSCLTAGSIDSAAVEFKLLESLLTTYNISVIIPDDGKEILSCTMSWCLFPYSLLPGRQQIIQRLEDSVIELSEAFPLFLYSVWKIAGYLSFTPSS